GLSIEPVNTEEEAMAMLRHGEANRVIAENQLNHTSSRSHAVLTVHLVVERSREDASPAATTSKLNLVDLAGNEKSELRGGMGTDDDAIVHRQSCYINKSLTFLEQVTIALADKTRDHVPFRQSKLTHLLKASKQDSLGGNCRTLMIACVWPRPDQLSQTLATLKFASRMRCVKNNPVVNDGYSSTTDEISRLQRQVRQLKTELAQVTHSRSAAGAPPLDTFQRREVWEEAGRFVL
ncbi:unnamed protein product, partial [Sphacelaria rigidula]